MVEQGEVDGDLKERPRSGLRGLEVLRMLQFGQRLKPTQSPQE